jgi:hypothetical protein
MRILQGSIEMAGNIRKGLAYYNCGETRVDAQLEDGIERCGGYGGFTYADRVLGYWLPLMREALGD